MARRARAYGIPPWELERALEEDPRAFRWVLVAPALDEFESALAAALKE